MALTTLQRQDLELGHLATLTLNPSGERVYLGRFVSSAPGRENLAVLALDPRTGAITSKRLYRDSDQPIPPTSKTVPVPKRPMPTVTAILVAPRYKKLYVAAPVADGAVRPARFLSVYDLDDNGDVLAGTLRTYRASADGVSQAIHLSSLALHPSANMLYLAGDKWNAIRYYLLDCQGEPQGDAPIAVPIPGAPRGTMAINPEGTRMFLGMGSATLQVLELKRVAGVDGVPQSTPLRTVTSTASELVGLQQLNFVYSPRALYAVRPLLEEAGRGHPPQPLPLFVLPLGANGDVDPGVTDWRRLDGFEHVGLAPDPTHNRLWLARQTSSRDAITDQQVTDGVQLFAYSTDAQGLPTQEQQRHPKRYYQQGLGVAVAATGEPVLLTQAANMRVNYVARQKLGVKISRVASGPSQPPLKLSCTLNRPSPKLERAFTAFENQFAEVDLDPFLSDTREQLALFLRFSPSGADTEWQIELRYAAEAAQDAVVKTDRVRGGMFSFLLPGHAFAPREQRAARFELMSEYARRYRVAAEPFRLAPEERPDQFVISAYSWTGMQGHAQHLDEGLAALRALGLNSVELRAWTGIPPAELGRRHDDFSPDQGTYSSPVGYFFDFVFDGSLVYDGDKQAFKGRTVDEAFIRDWYAVAARGFSEAFHLPASRVVRVQIGDESAWYLPRMLTCFRHEEPLTPHESDSLWRDATKNARWIRTFQDYVAARAPELKAFYGSGWERVVPIGVSQARTPETRRLFYWSMRFFSDQAALGIRRIRAAIEAAFRPPGTEPPHSTRPEHTRLHINNNFGDLLDWQSYKPYPDVPGDKNPDRGPDTATGGFNWSDFGAEGMPMPFKTSYAHDAQAGSWSFHADLLRSTADGEGGPKEFGGIIPGLYTGETSAGASYKLLSLVGAGAKIAIVYAFGPIFFFGPPNSWADNFPAYRPIADALRLIGRGQRLLYPGRPERGSVAIHLPSFSRLWDRQQSATFYTRELLPLHSALVHAGYSVDFLDDKMLEAGALASRAYTTLYLTGPNLGLQVQRMLNTWVERGGTLVALPGAGVADEVNEPSTLLDNILGVSARAAWTSMREHASLNPDWVRSRQLTVTEPRWRAALSSDEPLHLIDMVTAAASPVVLDLPLLEPRGAETVATMARADSAARPAITRNRHGRGTTYAYAFFPGWQYWSTATHPNREQHILSDRMPWGWSARDRLLITLPARFAETPRSVRLSQECVEARRLQSGRGIAVVLLNWNGTPVPSLTVSIDNPAGFRRVTSVKHGVLQNMSPERAHVSVQLPLTDVDVLLLEP